MNKYFSSKLLNRISLILISIGVILSRLDVFEKDSHTYITSSFLIGLGTGLSFAASFKRDHEREKEPTITE
jgi:hypothetical protein